MNHLRPVYLCLVKCSLFEYKSVNYVCQKSDLPAWVANGLYENKECSQSFMYVGH